MMDSLRCGDAVPDLTAVNIYVHVYIVCIINLQTTDADTVCFFERINDIFERNNASEDPHMKH